MTRDKLIETMARAIAGHNDDDYAMFPVYFNGEAEAALTALESIGMVVVPRDVDDEALGIHPEMDLWAADEYRRLWRDAMSRIEAVRKP